MSTCCCYLNLSPKSGIVFCPQDSCNAIKHVTQIPSCQHSVMMSSCSLLLLYTLQSINDTCVHFLQVAAAVFVFRGTVLTKRSNFAADLDVWRNANRDLYFAARAVKHLRLEMAQLQRQYPGVQWGFFCTGVSLAMALLLPKWGFILHRRVSCNGPSSALVGLSCAQVVLCFAQVCHAVGLCLPGCVMQ